MLQACYWLNLNSTGAVYKGSKQLSQKHGKCPFCWTHLEHKNVKHARQHKMGTTKKEAIGNEYEATVIEVEESASTKTG